MLLYRMFSGLAALLLSAGAMAGPLLLTFQSQIGDYQAEVILPDDSLLKKGSYAFEFWETSDEPAPALPSGWASGTFPAYDLETGWPTDTVFGYLSFPQAFYFLDFVQVRGRFATGGFYASGYADDRGIAFNHGGQSYFTDGSTSYVDIGEIPGLWKISKYKPGSSLAAATREVPEPGSLPLVLGVVGLLAAVQQRHSQKNRALAPTPGLPA